MGRSFFISTRYFKNSLLMLLLMFFISACGGSDGGNNTPTFNLVVNLFDDLINDSPSGDKVNISEVGGSLNFTCFQSEQNQDVNVDSRCQIVSSTTNNIGSGASIRFNSLPTNKTYTLTHFDSNDTSGGNCSVAIESSTSMVPQSPCTKVDSNSLTLTINSGITP